MWLRLLCITALTWFIAACSHAETKADAPAAPAKTQSSAGESTVEKTKSETSKKAEGSSGNNHYECAHKEDHRTLETRAKEKGCELAYTKAGKESVVASSGNGLSYCEKAMDKLRDKLSAAGYECK